MESLYYIPLHPNTSYFLPDRVISYRDYLTLCLWRYVGQIILMSTSTYFYRFKVSQAVK